MKMDEFHHHFCPVGNGNEDQGIVLLVTPTPSFPLKTFRETNHKENLKYLISHIKPYRKHLVHIAAGMLIGCVLQLVMPFLTQWIVDIGIKNKNISFIWLILLGEFVIIVGRTATDFIRRWLLMHISVRVNISLITEFFVKLLKLPMAFFDTKLMGDLLQRMSDHGRVQSFLTNQSLGLVFTLLSFIIFGVVLLYYDWLIFSIFVLFSLAYGVWTAMFLRRRKALDYEIFSLQAASQNRTYQFISTMQEIKLQRCEERRRHEWEDVQADLFEVQLKALKLQQMQEGGSVFINETKNIFITVLAAASVIHGSITLGEMLAIQYIVGQLNSPVSQLVSFIYSLQDVEISLERINEIRNMKAESHGRLSSLPPSHSFQQPIRVENLTFRYDVHSPKYALTNINLTINPGEKVAIVVPQEAAKPPW